LKRILYVKIDGKWKDKLTMNKIQSNH